MKKPASIEPPAAPTNPAPQVAETNAGILPPEIEEAERALAEWTAANDVFDLLVVRIERAKDFIAESEERIDGIAETAIETFSNPMPTEQIKETSRLSAALILGPKIVTCLEAKLDAAGERYRESKNAATDALSSVLHLAQRAVWEAAAQQVLENFSDIRSARVATQNAELVVRWQRHANNTRTGLIDDPKPSIELLASAKKAIERTLPKLPGGEIPGIVELMAIR